jgi:hypothetical protein
MAIIWADFPNAQLGLYGSNRNLMLNGVWAGFEGFDSFPDNNTGLVNDPDPKIGRAHV